VSSVSKSDFAFSYASTRILSDRLLIGEQKFYLIIGIMDIPLRTIVGVPTADLRISSSDL
jgi:hypothetical protein